MSEKQQYQIPNGEKFNHDDVVSLHEASSSLESLAIIKAAAEAHRAAAAGEKRDMVLTPSETLGRWSHNLEVKRKSKAAGVIDLNADDNLDSATLEQESLKFINLAHQEYKDTTQSDTDLAA